MYAILNTDREIVFYNIDETHNYVRQKNGDGIHTVKELPFSMGASDFDIVFQVMLVEARTSILMGATIALGTILGYSAMAGAVGGGGLGDIAVRYGYYRWQTDIMIITVILIILLFQLFQTIGMKTANKTDKRIHH